jgi:hypothetical protein
LPLSSGLKSKPSKKPAEAVGKLRAYSSNMKMEAIVPLKKYDFL